MYDLSEEISSIKNIKHSIEVVVDRLIMKAGSGPPPDRLRSRRRRTCPAGLSSSMNWMATRTPFSQNYACEDCGISMPGIVPAHVLVQQSLRGLPRLLRPGTAGGRPLLIIIPDRSKSILQGAIQASGWNNVRDDSISRMYFEALAKKYHFSLNDPIESLPQQALDVILYGTGTEKLTIYYERANGRGTLERPFEGVVNNVARRLTETQSDAMRKELEECMSERPCPEVPRQAPVRHQPRCHRRRDEHHGLLRAADL